MENFICPKQLQLPSPFRRPTGSHREQLYIVGPVHCTHVGSQVSHSPVELFKKYPSTHLQNPPNSIAFDLQVLQAEFVSCQHVRQEISQFLHVFARAEELELWTVTLSSVRI